MKHATNFRLEQDVLATITVLANDLKTTKTDVIEKAVIQYAASIGAKRNSLLQFAGSLDASEADTILNAIYQDKNSKDIHLQL